MSEALGPGVWAGRGRKRNLEGAERMGNAERMGDGRAPADGKSVSGFKGTRSQERKMRSESQRRSEAASGGTRWVIHRAGREGRGVGTGIVDALSTWIVTCLT